MYVTYNIGRRDQLPSKISQFFSPEFIEAYKIFAIREEEDASLKIFTRLNEVSSEENIQITRNHPSSYSHESIGKIYLACSRCGYFSIEKSNVRRHIKKSVCERDRGYSKDDLIGLTKTERERFIKRVAAAKFRARKKAENEPMKKSKSEGISTNQSKLTKSNQSEETNQFQLQNSNSTLTLTEGHQKLHSIQDEENSDVSKDEQSCSLNTKCKQLEEPSARTSRKKKILKRRTRNVLKLGQELKREPIRKCSFDVYIVNEKNMKIAWKPTSCHKASSGDCQIVFKGARMKRRCLDLPLPSVLIYRKLDCKIHNCTFTLFHPHSREIYSQDPQIRTTIRVKVFGSTVMTSEFYHHFVSLMTIMKLKVSQCTRHLTSVWEKILKENLDVDSVPPEFRKLITLSKQTVKAIWSSIDDEFGVDSPLDSNKLVPKFCHSMTSNKPVFPENRHLLFTSNENVSQTETFSQPSQSFQFTGFPDKHISPSQPVVTLPLQHDVLNYPQQIHNEASTYLYNNHLPSQQSHHSLYHVYPDSGNSTAHPAVKAPPAGSNHSITPATFAPSLSNHHHHHGIPHPQHHQSHWANGVIGAQSNLYSQGNSLDAYSHHQQSVPHSQFYHS